MDQDIQANCVRKAGSHTRNLLRVKRGLDMVKVLFEEIIASEYAFYLFPLLFNISVLLFWNVELWNHLDAQLHLYQYLKAKK